MHARSRRILSQDGQDTPQWLAGPALSAQRRRRRRLLLESLVALTLVGSLVGCSSAPAEQAEHYVEPAWMAQARQQVEEYQSAMVACLNELGVEGLVSLGGPVLTGGVTDDAGNLPGGVQELQEAASAECGARVPRPELWTAPADHAAYQRVIELRRCVVAQGYEVVETPSEETWIEQAGSGVAWSPYTELVGESAARIPDDDLRALMQACPQSGQGLQAVVPEDAFS